MRTRMSTLATLILAVVAVAMIDFSSVSALADNPGEATYKAKCAMCHGPDGKGETAAGKMMKVKDLASEDVQKLSDTDLTGAISKGKGKMPAFEAKLSKEQIAQLVTYLREIGKKH